ncbi:MAG TPA: bifunctional acetaldehyde-CoA/alcohol dehydrogenase [Solirubrobacter sp.]|nr:bifunctional acetaldehyde-CoA/alcohol dehydrogenase [Solirubrobacter sp.]
MTATLDASAEAIARWDATVERAEAAAAAFRAITDQVQVDRIVRAMVIAGLEAAVELAELALEETGFGVLEDKVIKNYLATEFLYDHLQDKRSVGVIDEDPERAIEYVAEPIGVVLALLPITNPTSTALFKSIVAAKTRNAMIFRPSARAARCATRAVDILQRAGEAEGLPPDALQVIPDATLEASQYLFHHPGVDLIWTTGGPKAVAAANEAGKPCISVGPGNAPVYVHRSADVAMAAVDLLLSKTFDSSVICPAEQTCVVDDPIHDAFVTELQRLGARILNADEVERLAAAAFDADGRAALAALGRSCVDLAALAGIAPGEAKILVAPLPTDLDALAAHPLLQEKLMPVLGLVRSPTVEHALAACDLVTEHGGLGHTSAVYARDEAVVRAFAQRIRTGRILVNAPTAVGALGGVYTAMPPTFSLGCGTWGGSTTTDNVNYRNLLNIKAVSRRKAPPQWFRVPSGTYFNAGALDGLRAVPTRTAVIVTDAPTEARGAVDEVRRHLACDALHVIGDIEPEPGEPTVRAGAELLDRLRPDLLVAVGGGSVLDAAKAMRLFHEHPEVSLRELTLPFLDARKRVARYPQDEHTVRLAAVPTTAGTGSEVSPAAVLTVGERKVTLVDYTIVPDVAVVDPTLTLTMPPELTADTGIDAVTHALEAYVSIFASPYTDAFCLQAIHLIFDALPRAFADGSDLAARTDMANAATIAGLAFSNAFLGINHALAHAVGARFGIAHGRVNGIFLPHVLRHNAAVPSKFMPAPGYSAYVAPQKFAQIAWVLGLGGRGEAAARERLFARVDELLRTVGIPRTLAETGITRKEWERAKPDLCRAAFADPSGRTNPRMPMLAELAELLDAAYET